MTIDEIQNALKFDMYMQLFDGMTGETKTKESLKYGNEMNYIHYCANEEAIQLLEELKELRNQLEYYKSGNCENECEHIEALEQSRWISVEDRLPEECETVLATVNDSIGTYVISCWLDEYGNWSNGDDCLNVTHWQPLPAPPSIPKMEQVETEKTKECNQEFCDNDFNCVNCAYKGKEQE